jgi:hypothetical protein
MLRRYCRQYVCGINIRKRSFRQHVFLDDIDIIKWLARVRVVFQDITIDPALQQECFQKKAVPVCHTETDSIPASIWQRI